ncbi:MAG: peptidoglycan DD-metalloendopeptidase family protein [Gammaproteobacteria bacterium]|nr:peptidoglycan DD-metalloendopeptidase family protein [Gammaproteobacteria bacterium]
MKTLLTSIAMLLAATAQAASIEDGRRLTDAFYAGDTATIWQEFDARMQQTMGSEAQLEQFRTQIETQLGEESRIIDEQMVAQQGYTVYLREVNYARGGDTVFIVQWAFDAEGKVAGFAIRPKQQSVSEATLNNERIDYETQAELRLPFEGEWFVFWGGTSLEDNYHARSRDQRYAHDFLVMHENRSHVGDGSRNADYHCWGKAILAPAGGKVIHAEDGLPDMEPGKMDPQNPPGNHVVIDHGNSEYSFLAHLQQGSVTVAPGDTVQAGDRVGACGNSGNTSEPHLHYHLQDSPEFGKGRGLPARFNDYRADGERIARGIPVKGQQISVR